MFPFIKLRQVCVLKKYIYVLSSFILCQAPNTIVCKMESILSMIYSFLSLGNVLLLLLLLFILHYLMILYEFRNMPPGPRLTTLPILGNFLSLDLNVTKLNDAFFKIRLLIQTFDLKV